MIRIEKFEVEQIKKRFPALHITKTVNKFYVEERPKVMAFLKKIRSGGAIA